MFHEITYLPNTCQRCGKKEVVTDYERGEQICGLCGWVIEDKLISFSPEWRTEFTESDKSRIGPSFKVSRHDHGLTTIIGYRSIDAAGKPLSSKMKMAVNRLRTQDNRSKIKNPFEQNYREAFSILERMKEKLSLSVAISENAAYIYRKAVEKRITRGRSIQPFILACLYAASRLSGSVRTLNEFALLSNTRKKDISRSYRLLLRSLELRIPSVDSVDCISKIASRLGLSEKSRRCALKILEEADKFEILAGKDPTSMAAAALYFSCVKTGERPRQREIAKAAMVSDVTIRNRYKELIRWVEI